MTVPLATCPFKNKDIQALEHPIFLATSDKLSLSPDLLFFRASSIMLLLYFVFTSCYERFEVAEKLFSATNLKSKNY